MKGNPEERAVQLGEYITETGATVRSAAKAFGISKSTVHKDITYRLEKQNHTLYDEVQKVLRVNKEERHLRGHTAEIPSGNRITGNTAAGRRQGTGCRSVLPFPPHASLQATSPRQTGPTCVL